MKRLEELWGNKERLRSMWRKDKENIILQTQFARICNEWDSEFTKALSKIGIGTKTTISGTTYYDLNTNHIIVKRELQLKLKKMLDVEFVERIGFDL